jgi:hypothetical protein
MRYARVRVGLVAGIRDVNSLNVRNIKIHSSGEEEASDTFLCECSAKLCSNFCQVSL